MYKILNKSRIQIQSDSLKAGILVGALSLTQLHVHNLPICKKGTNYTATAIEICDKCHCKKGKKKCTR